MGRLPRQRLAVRDAPLPRHDLSGRAAPLATRELISAGFQELERTETFLASPELTGLDTAALLKLFRLAPDPDQALLLLIRLLERAPQLRELFDDEGDDDGAAAAGAMIRLLGASRALGEFLIRHPEHTDLFAEAAEGKAGDSKPAGGAGEAGSTGNADGDVVVGGANPVGEVAHAPAPWWAAETLRAVLLEAVGADPQADTPEASLAEDFSAAAAAQRLRILYRRWLTRLAVEDLSAADPEAFQPIASRRLADLASAAVEAALAVTRAELRHRRREAARIELAVIGMGKCGARELNYISDVDVVFVHAAPEDMEAAAARDAATALASGIARHIGASTGEPGLWEVDANLRPEGKDGPLTRTLDSHVEYYKRWAHGWEFQALLKARPIAGSPRLGQEYIEAISPLVWQSSAREGFVEDVQAMRRRVFENIPAATAAQELKLGRGGLRDIEFTVQLLQLVHGRTDESIHVRDTLSAIAALAQGEYVSSTDAEAMTRCYRRLRLLEHRIQMSQMRRTHLMPQEEDRLRPLAHAVRPPGAPRSAAKDVVTYWQKAVKEVATFHEKIFYRPLLSSTAALSDAETRLSSEAAQARLTALGYRDASGALRHIQALTTGVSRRATLQKRILPVMLGWFAEGVDPDAGLLAFRRLSESLGQSPWYLTMLRDSSMAAERLAYILSSSRFIADMLEHSPESAQWLGDDGGLAPRDFEQLWTEVSSAIARHKAETSTAVRLARLVRQRETLRIALADACGLISLETVSAALTRIDRVATLGALRVAELELEEAEGLKVEFLVVAMGRQGGQEISYGSDMDAMYVHRALPGHEGNSADQQAQKLAQRLSQLLSKPVRPAVRGEFMLQIDADLRPEGKKGPLSRSMESFAEYYRRWMDIWERQALLRARPIAGSDELARDFMNLVDEVRYGEPPSSSDVREVRRIKARVESERLPRGADPSRHVKLGRGALSDVEWLVQLMQLQHAHRHGQLRTTSTLGALNALVDCQLLSPQDATRLADAWTLCTRVRSAIMIWSGRTSDVLPSSRRDLEAVSRWCGFDAGQAGAFEEHYLRTTRRARQVYERIFYES